MQLETLKPLMAWLHLNPEWAGLAVFAFAFIESIAVVGLVVPGFIILSAFGILVGTGILPLTTTVIWTIAGAFVGDLLSYWLGHRYRNHIQDLWPFRLIPQWFARGEDFFKRHGGKSIILGRFIGPLRPLLPIIAGILNLSPQRFIYIDMIAVIIWAPLFMLPGFLIGAASLTLPPEVTTRITLYLIIALVAIWLFFWLLKRSIYALLNFFDHSLQKIWLYLQKHPKFGAFSRLIEVNGHPEDYLQLGLLILFLMTLGIFLFLLGEIIVTHSRLPINIAIFHLMNSLFNVVMQKIAICMTLFGDKYLIGTLWFTIFIWLSWQRYWVAVVHWVVIGCLSAGMIGILHHAVASNRPPFVVSFRPNWSFPSGHTTLSLVIYGFLAVLITRGQDYFTRYVTFITVTMLIFAVALSRLYLNVHWFTDILASFSLGLALLLGMTLSYRCQNPPVIQLRGLLIAAILSISFSYALLLIFEFQNNVVEYTPCTVKQYVNTQNWWKNGLHPKPYPIMNRFGKPIQTINVEWGGSLASIEASLTQKGWVKIEKHSFLKNLYPSEMGTEVNVGYKGFYADRLPVLVMTRHFPPISTVPDVSDWMVLRLWDSRNVFRKTLEPLWIGTINYASTTHNQNFFIHLKEKYKVTGKKNKSIEAKQAKISQPSITYQFIHDLPPLQYKIIDDLKTPKLANRADINWDGHIVLVLN